MEFHISRALRDKLDLDDLLFAFNGNVIFGNVAASRTFAAKLTALRQDEDPAAEPVNAGALFAMGLIDELSHAMIAQFRRDLDPAVLSAGLAWFAGQISAPATEALLLAFSEEFPNVAIYRAELTAAEWLGQTTGQITEDLPHREAALEELLLLWLANQNPAFAPFRELFNDASLTAATEYKRLTAALPAFFETRPLVSPSAGTLLDVLRAPMLASPDSLSGQLEFIRQNWVPYLGEDLRRTLLAIDILREEDLAIWMRFHPAGPDRHRHRGDGWSAEGFEGDEYVGFDGLDGPGRRRRRYASDHQAPLNEYEAFSEDQAWMPTVVLMAKSTYVWLEQLSKKYGRHIHRLDQIPDEELRLLAGRGMTGLWLIGLWERSIASRTIKRLRGQEDAVASAYSLKDYGIAEDLGGPGAYEYLRDRAAAAGIRLASDMVPNHMGIDSTWVVEHPDWFISRPESPFPSYSFEGPDLSTDSRVEIKIEDHYFDQTDAAVVFRLRHHANNETRFVYHGNDGTTFAWNDTAQLDYSKAYVREQVIQAILHVARLFPIIRFDAAMTLAKRHVQRLWFPLPGVGGSIPSRAESAMTQEEFDAVMPHEFWREVVDRVAVEVPGTLLLAEAFWMLEGYFVRTLGMHRVYNSAFMNMLRDEENAKYRSYLKKTIEFDPDILKRYVNFMSNPDERTTIDQFGSGDKCFGVATLMSTLPGLPMFGHGQIEGFTERYGMEYKRARMDETPNEGLAARHQHEIAPLLKRRHVFAESAHFVLYDLWTDHGTVDENVFAYSNRSGDERALILYNNVYNSTRGTVHTSVAAMDKYTGQLRQRQLSEALGLPSDDGLIVGYRDAARGLSFLRRSRDFEHHGLAVDLRGYQYMVLQDWRELRSTAEYPWEQLCDALGGGGVHNLDEALSKLRLRPLHESLRQVLSRETTQAFLDVAHELSTPAPTSSNRPKAAAAASSGSAAIDARVQPFLESGAQFTASATRFLPNGVSAQPATSADLAGQVAAALRLPTLEHRFSSAWPVSVQALIPCSGVGAASVRIWAPALAWLLLASDPATAATANFDDLQLRSALADAFSALELPGDDAWRAAARVRLLLAYTAQGVSATLGSRAFWSDGDVLWLGGINHADGSTWVNQEQFEELLVWLHLPALLALNQAESTEALAAIEATLAKARGIMADSGYKLEEFQTKWIAQPAAPSPPQAPRTPYKAAAKTDPKAEKPAPQTAVAAPAPTSPPTAARNMSVSNGAKPAEPAAKASTAKPKRKPNGKSKR